MLGYRSLGSFVSVLPGHMLGQDEPASSSLAASFALSSQKVTSSVGFDPLPPEIKAKLQCLIMFYELILQN